MMFREKPINRLCAFALAAVFALALAGCGGGGGSTATGDDVTMPTPQETCEGAGGRWNADETCTSAGDLAAERMAAQRAGVAMALEAAETAVGAVDNDSTDAEVSAADAAVAAARSAIADAENIPAEEKAANTGTVDALASRLADAKTARTAAMDAAQTAADMAMMATARKLHAGIGLGVSGTDNTVAAGTALTNATDRAAAYNDVDQPTAGTAVDTRIMVGIGTATPVALSEDKDATVAGNHGWTGKKYEAEPDGDGTYEAVVYSNVGEPTEGAKFNAGGGDDGGYALATTASDTVKVGELAITGDVATATGRIASSRFDQSAGTKEFELGTNLQRVVISGSYHGVSGTYYCTPAASSTCAVQVAASGFTLGGTADADNAFTAGGGTWAFKPANPEARLMSAPDAVYASYGWWIKKSEDGNTFTASAFVDDRGAVPDAASLDTLQGTATYMGGAAGKYALHSATGGTNDAGHFTARATLEADFSDNSITGTIDRFMGADGEARNWSVELKEAAVAATGGITRTADNDTVWTIDGTAAAASGEWSGALKDNGDDGVPKVGTGTFYSGFSTGGKMGGAF
jgi:hypothetical protein